MNRKSMWMLAVLVLALGVVSGVAVSGQDKYTLKLPGGIAFSDFKGYEDWQLISSAETEDRMKVILGNPAIIAAFKAGIPGNGKPFPEGSKIAKVQWKPKKSTEAPFSVNVPDTLADLFFMEKDSKKISVRPADGDMRSLTTTRRQPHSVWIKPVPLSCGQGCHVAVKTKDYVFHPYEMR
jgi:hypothetical protein